MTTPSLKDDGFMNFINAYILDTFYKARDDIMRIGMMFDENSELGPDSNANIVFMCDFHNNLMRLCHINTNKAFMAYQATLGEQTEETKVLLEEFVNMVKQTII
jgi:hypothetical protein